VDHNRVNEAKDRRCESNSQGEGEQGNNGEKWATYQLSDAVMQMSYYVSHDLQYGELRFIGSSGITVDAPYILCVSARKLHCLRVLDRLLG